MTVEELIEELQDLDPKSTVFICMDETVQSDPVDPHIPTELGGWENGYMDKDYGLYPEDECPSNGVVPAVVLRG